MNDVKRVATGWYHSFIVKNDDTVWGTGWNIYGHLGDTTTEDKHVFTLQF